MAGQGNLLSEFNTFVTLQGPAFIDRSQGGKSIANLAGKRNYKWFEAAADNKLFVRGGSSIKRKFIFKTGLATTNYKPGYTRTYPNPQVTRVAQWYWRFTEVPASWIEQELLLNPDMGVKATADVKVHVFGQVWDEKQAQLKTALADGFEGNLTAVPDFATMEGDNADQVDPYSLWVYLNEGGVTTSAATHTGRFGDTNSGITDFTTIAGLTLAQTESKWKCQYKAYTSSAANNRANVIGAFEDMWEQTRYEQPRLFSEYFTVPTYSKQKILASKAGTVIYKRLIASENAGGDRMIAGGQDPSVPSPQFHGIPVTSWDSLDAAAIYDNDNSGSPSALVTEMAGAGTAASDALNNGPRYYWWNMGEIYPVVHQEKYFDMSDPAQRFEDKDTWGVVCKTYNQLVADDLRGCGVVGPIGDIYTA